MLFCVKGKIFFSFSCKLFFHRCISPSFSACLDGREGWGKILLFLKWSSKSRRTYFKDIGVFNIILLIKDIGESPADCLTVIHGNSAWFVNIRAKVPGTSFFHIFYIYQLKPEFLYDRLEKCFCLLFIIFSSGHAASNSFSSII